MRYKKYFTVKAWNKFDLTQQDILCCRYDIILTNYKTRKEKILNILKKFNGKNLDKGISKFNKGVNQFMDIIAEEKPQRQSKRKPKKVPRHTPHYSDKEAKEREQYMRELLGYK